MKELDKIQTEQQEIRKTFPKGKQHLGKVRVHPGQKLWQMDLSTRIIQECQPTEIGALDQHGKPYTKREFITQPGFIYAIAINVQNADRKFMKQLGIKLPKAVRPIPLTDK